MKISIKNILENKLKIFVSVLSSIIFIITSVLVFDRYVAKSADLDLLAGDFYEYKVEQELSYVNKKIWETEDRLSKKDDSELRERLIELKAQKEKLLRQLDSTKGKAKKLEQRWF